MLLATVLLAQALAPPPTPDPMRYLLVNSDRAWRKAMHKPVAPAFPAELRTAVQVTTVVIDAVVDSQGRITRASIVKGDSRAHEAALRAAMQWGFEIPERDTSGHQVRLSFTFRTLPATASAKELKPDFSEKFRVEIRARVATPSPEP
jgi:TonB family protein